MALPKHRHSKSRRDKRRTHWKLKVAAVTQCPQCGKAIRPHHACPFCGIYCGRQVLVIAKKKGAADS